MQLKNLEALRSEINHLEEAEELLHELFFGFGSIHTVLREHKEEFSTDVRQLITRLDNHFNIDDSE